MTTSRSIAIVAGFILCTGVSSVQATIVEWKLQNVRFDDGGTATGFISLDVDHDGFGPTPGSLPEFVDWSIKVSGGNTASFPPFEYTPASTFDSYADGVSLTFFTYQMIPGGDPNQRRMLYLVIHPKMTDAGGTVILTSANSPSRESWNPEPIRIASGALTSGVPEPSRRWFLTLGVVALLGAWARRKR